MLHTYYNQLKVIYSLDILCSLPRMCVVASDDGQFIYLSNLSREYASVSHLRRGELDFESKVRCTRTNKHARRVVKEGIGFDEGAVTSRPSSGDAADDE
jgi:hypothetical protein